MVVYGLTLNDGKRSHWCENCRADIEGGVKFGRFDDGPCSLLPSDGPEYCDDCGVFLENPLTPDGLAALRSQLADTEHAYFDEEELITFYFPVIAHPPVAGTED